MSERRRPPSPRHPAALRPGDVTALACLLAGLALVRSFDYFTPGQQASSPALETMRIALPIEAWGTLLGVGAIALLAGLAARWPRVIFGAHVLLAAIYAGLSVSLGAEYVTRPYFDGIRSATDLIAPAVVHAALALRCAIPDRRSRGH